jgi:hypothetical protein
LGAVVAAIAAVVAAVIAAQALQAANSQLKTLVADSQTDFSYSLYSDISNSLDRFIQSERVAEGAFSLDNPSFDAANVDPSAALPAVDLLNLLTVANTLRTHSPEMMNSAYWQFVFGIVCETLSSRHYGYLNRYYDRVVGITTASETPDRPEAHLVVALKEECQ